MEKQTLISQAEQIKQALNAISVSGYGNIKTLANCIEALMKLQKDIDSYEKDIQEALAEQVKKIMSEAESAANDQGIIPENITKPKPKRIKKEGDDNEQN